MSSSFLYITMTDRHPTPKLSDGKNNSSRSKEEEGDINLSDLSGEEDNNAITPI